MDELRLSAGQRIGRYEILAPLGASGENRLFRAEDHRLDRFVTIRAVESGGYGGPDRRRRFLTCARDLAALRHPNIPAIYDFLCGDGLDLIVLEPLSGETLEASIPVGGMRPEVARRLALEVADALAAAHKAGIVHGNLRPGTILLDDERHIRILDFGLSSLAPVPAQRGEGGPGDVFALGAILYEALTGRRPGPEPDPLPGTVPPGLAALVMRCLSGEVRTAREVVAAIGKVMTG